MFLFLSSIFTPGTIFLLIFGAFRAAFPDIEPWIAIVLNIVPVFMLCLAIYLCRDEVQVNIK